MIEAIIMAFSTYTRIPMPILKMEKAEKGMKYILCAFPLTGVIIGAIQLIMIYFFGKVVILNSFFKAAMLTVAPILITGGIHLDGFMDVSDAKNSFRSKEEKLRIMKDPHIGAFAVIYLAIYLVLTFGFYCQMMDISDISFNTYMVLFGVYPLERVLSGIAVATFPKARAEGMSVSVSRTDGVNTRFRNTVLVTEGIILSIIMSLLGTAGMICIAASLINLGLFYRLCVKDFGGVTGDLAGYFLQLNELLCIIIVTVVSLF